MDYFQSDGNVVRGYYCELILNEKSFLGHHSFLSRLINRLAWESIPDDPKFYEKPIRDAFSDFVDRETHYALVNREGWIWKNGRFIDSEKFLLVLEKVS